MKSIFKKLLSRIVDAHAAKPTGEKVIMRARKTAGLKRLQSNTKFCRDVNKTIPRRLKPGQFHWTYWHG